MVVDPMYVLSLYSNDFGLYTYRGKVLCEAEEGEQIMFTEIGTWLLQVFQDNYCMRRTCCRPGGFQ